MTQPEFHLEIDKLSQIYGSNKYPDERRRILYARFRYVPLDEFKRVIDNFIGSASFAPLLEEFQTALRQVMAEIKKNDEASKSIGDCVHCGGDGLVFSESEVKGERGYVGRCICLRGEFYNHLAVSKKLKNH